MNRMNATPDTSRRGTVMIVVLGLITIMLGLALGLAVKVYNGIKGGSVTQQNAQAWIMMQAARKMVLDSVSVPTTGMTIGDLQPGDLPGKELASALGWARLKPNGANLDIIACGGSSGSGGKVGFSDGSALRNAMDVRYYYTLHAAPAVAPSVVPTVTVTPQPAQDDNYANRW